MRNETKTKYREETIILPCGCKVGGNKGGPYFYDFICEKHLPEVQENGKFSYAKSEIAIKKLNEKMKENPLEKEEFWRGVYEKSLSKTEQQCFDAIKNEKEIPIVELPINLQGAVGKLISKGLVEKFRKPHTWEIQNPWDKKPRKVSRTTNWVKLKE